MSEGRRKAIPAMVKLEVALRALGLSIKRVRFDHEPALELRPLNAEGTDTVPPANDPLFIQILTVEDHAEKTFGTKATTAGSDINKIAKHRRITREQEEYRRRMLAKTGQAEGGEVKQERRKRAWPKRPMRSGRREI